MASIARPTMVSNPSSHSSPPPSPVATASPSSPAAHRSGEQVISQPLGINTASDRNKTPTRPRLPGRQETPPSPPNSVVLGDQSPVSLAMQKLPPPVGPVNQRIEHGHPQDSTPPASLKQRITRAFKVGHKRGESDLSRSTNTTDDTIQQDTSGYLSSPLKENSPMYPNKPSFYTRQPVAPIHPENHLNTRSSTKRKVMNGGEVRVEILPHPRSVGGPSNYRIAHEEPLQKKHDASDPYYKYYTRTSRDADQEFDEDEEIKLQKSDPESEEEPYLPPLNRQDIPVMPPQRSQTVITQSSAESRERIYVEESISFGFEGFHIGNGSNHSDGTFAGLSSPTSPTFFTGAGIYSNSGKASSSVLNYLNQSDLNMLSRDPSIRTTPVSTKGTGRPGMSRNASSASYFSPGMRRVSSGPGRSGSPQFDEAVTRELRRLSKISAGSGTSGFAMVITTDGAASTRLGREPSDEEMDRIVSERKFTKEEKGKGKAVSSVASESVAERKGADSRNAYQGTGHQHTISDASRFIRSDGSEGSSDNGDSDGTRLLRGLDDGSGRRKLKSQEVPKGVLVHEGDAKYDFVYRMRQTSDEIPILVPQYFYPTDGFPNRNALTTPIRAKLSPLAPINTSNIGAVSFINKYGSSPITMPQSAVKRSPGSNSSYYIRMGGDQAVDPQDESPRFLGYESEGSNNHRGSITHSLGYNKIQSLIHPALRTLEQPTRKRPITFMGSLEGITSFELGRLVTGTPNGTGRRLAGSSLADDSDIMSNGLGESPDKRTRRVRMSGVDEINFIPPLKHNTATPCRTESKVWIPRHSTRLPMRPKTLRRSMTPRLYDPRPLGDSWKDLSNYDAEAMGNEPRSRAYRMREKKVSRILLALCLLFPPLLLVAAMGSFDTMVDAWTDGEVKGVGRIEKRIAAVVGGVFAIGAVVGGVVAAVVVAS